MASYHFGSDGKPVKCNTADPNGVCRIHGNMDIQANSAEEAQHKYNAMKRDEANAEDMSEMPLEYVTEVWKIHCDSINEGNDDGMGPKTIDVIANKPGVWESLDENAADMLAESANSVNVNDDVKNTFMLRFGNIINEFVYDESVTHIIDSAPKWVLRLNGYKPATDVVGDVADYFGFDVAEDEVQSAIGFSPGARRANVNVADGVVRRRVMKDKDDNLWVDQKTSDEIKWQYFDIEYELRCHRTGIADSVAYMKSEQYQQEISDYCNAMGLSL